MSEAITVGEHLVEICERDLGITPRHGKTKYVEIEMKLNGLAGSAGHLSNRGFAQVAINALKEACGCDTIIAISYYEHPGDCFVAVKAEVIEYM